MPSLTNEQKVFIVCGFAALMTPSEVSEAVNEEFKIKTTRQQVWRYSPDNPQTAEKWKVMYKERHERFLGDVSTIGVANKSYRLSEMQRLYRRIRRTNPQLALMIFEQAAKEMGGAFTNQRVLTGPKGGPIQTVEMTLEEWKANAARRRAEAEEAVANFDGD